MMPRAHRLTRSADFAAVIRRGRRAGSSTLVLHHLRPAPDSGTSTELPSRVGLVVSRTVGNSVTRNRVKRRLRHEMAARLDRLPSSSMSVVRALPASAAASSDRLGADLDAVLERLAGGGAR